MNDLIERLRAGGEIIRTAKIADPLLIDLRDFVNQCADALEANAKRIAELEAQLKLLREIESQHALLQKLTHAELEAQQYRCIRCMGWCSDNYCPDCGKGHAGKVSQLEAQVKALEVDAGRYRWLCEASNKKVDFYSKEHRWMVSRDNGDGTGQNFFGDKISVEIDAAKDQA